jgi:rubrerythrin
MSDWDIHTCTPKPGLCDECETAAHCLKHGCIPKVRSTIDMAREANLLFPGVDKVDGSIGQLKRFEALVRADERTRTWTQEHWTEYERSIAAVEREACAKVCEELAEDERADNERCAAAIRARGQA